MFKVTIHASGILVAGSSDLVTIKHARFVGIFHFEILEWSLIDVKMVVGMRVILTHPKPMIL